MKGGAAALPRLLVLLVTISALIVADVSVVSADDGRRRDADDATGPLDIAWIRHSHRTSDRGVHHLVHTVRLFEPWPVRRLRHRGYINLFFDLPGNRDWREERALYISYENGRLRAEMINFGVDPPESMKYVALWRPNRRTVKVAFGRSLLSQSDFGYYTWRALSFIEEGHELCDRSGGCTDSTGELRHDV